MILRSLTSGRYYEPYLKNSGLISLIYRPAGFTPDHVARIHERCLINTARTKSFYLGVKDTDLANPLLTLTQHENVHLGRPYILFTSPNGREWEVTCTQDGVYRLKALTIDWPRARSPIIPDDTTGTPWTFVVNDGGEHQLSDQATDHRQSCILKAQDGSCAYRLTIAGGILQVSDALPATDARFYDAEMISEDGTHWLLRIDQNGILSVDSEWEDAINRAGDEWPLLLADRRGTMYVVDSRFPPPLPGFAQPRGRRGYW